jgi:hypothetical protein
MQVFEVRPNYREQIPAVVQCRWDRPFTNGAPRDESALLFLIEYIRELTGAPLVLQYIFQRTRADHLSSGGSGGMFLAHRNGPARAR